jgi:hypothetical protein
LAGIYGEYKVVNTRRKDGLKRSKVLKVKETDCSLEIEDRMSSRMRVMFLIFAIIPLLAPYELIVKPGWTSYLNPFFLLAAAVSLGALVVSTLLFWAAVAGLSFRLRFDKSRGTFTHWSLAPVIPLRKHDAALQTISCLEIETHDWFEGPLSYTLKVLTADGSGLQVGSSDSLAEIKAIRDRVASFLRR